MADTEETLHYSFTKFVFIGRVLALVVFRLQYILICIF